MTKSSTKNTWNKAKEDKLIKVVRTIQKEVGKPDHEAHKVDWKKVGKEMNLTPGSCQARWNTHLDPTVDRSAWTPELDARLLELYKDKSFNSWSKRAAELARGKTTESGLPMRRSGADVCERYFFLKKNQG